VWQCPIFLIIKDSVLFNFPSPKQRFFIRYQKKATMEIVRKISYRVTLLNSFLFISIFSLIHLQQSVHLFSQTLTMYYFLAGLFLPMINALLTVKIYQNSFYYHNSSCAFLRNTSLSNDASIQSCIWTCQDEYGCQTAVYYNDNKTCSMFSEVCTTGRIESSGSTVASVICYRKNHRELVST